MNEHEAVARLQRGDIGGLETLVHQYQVRAVRLAYLITRDPALADDIMQAAERTAVVQRYYLGLSEAEIAAASGRPRSTVKRVRSAWARRRTQRRRRQFGNSAFQLVGSCPVSLLRTPEMPTSRHAA